MAMGDLARQDEYDQLIPPPRSPFTGFNEGIARGFAQSPLLFGTGLETPGTLTEEDQFRANQMRQALTDRGVKSGFGVVMDPVPGLAAVAAGLPLRGAAALGAGAAQGKMGAVAEQPAVAPEKSFFDYRKLGELPDVKQFDLPRYNPPRGVSPRVQDLITNKQVRDEMLGYLERGQKMGAGEFYGTYPLRQSFVSELGKKEGPQAFGRYMDYVAGSSPRSTVPENARNASYYYVLDRQGQPMPSIGADNPYPYGHLAQELHQRNAQTVSGPGWDVIKNPKPPSFGENLKGNWQPVAVDAHAFKLPAMISRDPRFLAGSIKLEKGQPTINPSKMFESGEISMDDLLKRPAFWASKPNPNEYAAMENYWKGLGRELGYPAPAYGQASGWSGGGDVTGLKSVSAQPFLRAVENRMNLTAAERGITPEEALSQFIRGKAPLLTGAGVAGMGALARQDQYQQ
jgi:hypothetical protein